MNWIFLLLHDAQNSNFPINNKTYSPLIFLFNKRTLNLKFIDKTIINFNFLFKENITKLTIISYSLKKKYIEL